MKHRDRVAGHVAFDETGEPGDRGGIRFHGHRLPRLRSGRGTGGGLLRITALQLGHELFGKSRSFFYDLRKGEKIKFYKFEPGERSASFIKIGELEAALKPEN